MAVHQELSRFAGVTLSVFLRSGVPETRGFRALEQKGEPAGEILSEQRESKDLLETYFLGQARESLTTTASRSILAG